MCGNKAVSHKLSPDAMYGLPWITEVLHQVYLLQVLQQKSVYFGAVRECFYLVPCLDQPERRFCVALSQMGCQLGLQTSFAYFDFFWIVHDRNVYQAKRFLAFLRAFDLFVCTCTAIYRFSSQIRSEAREIRNKRRFWVSLRLASNIDKNPNSSAQVDDMRRRSQTYKNHFV